MPLQIKLPPKERIIINGAVIENGATPTTLILHTRADILRRKDVLTEEEATTPARLAYYTLQCAYIFEDERERFLTTFADLAARYEEAAPSAKPILDKARTLLDKDALYSALREIQSLLKHEAERFRSVNYTPPAKRSIPSSPWTDDTPEQPPRTQHETKSQGLHEKS